MTPHAHNDHRHAVSHRRGHSIHRIISGIASLADVSDRASQPQHAAAATGQTPGNIAPRRQLFS